MTLLFKCMSTCEQTVYVSPEQTTAKTNGQTKKKKRKPVNFESFGSTSISDTSIFEVPEPIFFSFQHVMKRLLVTRLKQDVKRHR